mgnify:FL=1
MKKHLTLAQQNIGISKLAEIKKFYEILVNLSNRIKPPPTGAITGSVDILSKQVNMNTGRVMGSDVAQDNLKKMGLEIKQSTIDGILRKNSDRISSIGISGKEDLKKAGEKMKEGGLTIIDILRPITDAMADIWSEILTPPDDTISKEEQKEKTMAAFAGIIVGLGQALVSLGTGALLASKGFEEAIKGNVPAALAMIAGGSALIAIGKGQLQKVKRSAAARESATGGGANDGSNGNSMASFLKAVQGEQTFRINGADLVSVVGRQNNFTNAIGG